MTLPKGFCECGHKKEFHSDLDNKCTQCQCVKFGENKRNRYCDCGHQQSNHLENFNECTQCNCKKLRIRPDSKPKPSTKVKFLVGIWVIVVCLEIVLPINYWVVNFGWGFFNNSNYDVLKQWQWGFIFTIIGGAVFFEIKWKFFSPYDSDKYEIVDGILIIAFPTFISVFVGIAGYILAEWVGVVLGVAGVCIVFAFVYLSNLDKLKTFMAKK